MIHYSQILSDFVYNLKFEDLPDDVVETTKRYIADYYAASFAGIKVNGTFNDAVIGVISEMGGKEECDYIYSDNRLPVSNAAFLSACMAHGADMDDGNRKAMGHVGAHVISTALTLCQILDVNGKDIITAINPIFRRHKIIYLTSLIIIIFYAFRAIVAKYSPIFMVIMNAIFTIIAMGDFIFFSIHFISFQLFRSIIALIF